MLVKDCWDISLLKCTVTSNAQQERRLSWLPTSVFATCHHHCVGVERHESHVKPILGQGEELLPGAGRGVAQARVQAAAVVPAADGGSAVNDLVGRPVDVGGVGGWKRANYEENIALAEP